MIDLTVYVNIVVVVICGCIGFAIKHITWLQDLANSYIPAILIAMGTILSIVDAIMGGNAITLAVIASGMVSGLVSTGIHQLITRLADQISGSDTK